MHADVNAERLEDWRGAGFDPQVTALLELIEKLNTNPHAVQDSDIERARAAGVSDAAMIDAPHVCFVFNLINRLVNAFGYSMATEADWPKTAKVLHRTGYRVPGFLLR